MAFRILKFPIVFAVLGVLVFGFLCAGLTSHASMHDGMSAAAMTSATTDQKCCNISISKYLGSWKDTLLASPRDMRDILILLTLGLLFALASAALSFLYTPKDNKSLSFRLYARDNPNLPLFDHLRLVFAQGILNPKIY